MIDRGLLASIALIGLVTAALDRRLRRRGDTEEEPVSALAAAPLAAGLLAGRLVAVAQDDPATLRRPFDLLLIRGGVEFWPGVVAAVAVAWVGARRRGQPPAVALAKLAPFALWAYAAYEAACLLRDGCFGPPAPVGLRPGGVGDRQLPVGLLVALAVAGVGILVWRCKGRLGPPGVLALSVSGLAAARAAAGFVLPKVSAGLTRAHRQSLAVLAVVLLAWAVVGTGRAVGRRAVAEPSDPPAGP